MPADRPSGPIGEADRTRRRDRACSPRLVPDGGGPDVPDDRASVAGFYGRYAGLYDRIATAPGVGRWRRRAAAALDPEPGDTIVEMGCGTGANAPYLRERVGPDGRVVGIDITGPLLRRARERADGWETVAFVRGDATQPPVERVDGLLASFLVGLLDDPAGAVETWCDLVAAGGGGRVALLDAAPSGHPVGRLLNPAFGAFVGAGAPAPTLAASARQALAGALGGGGHASLTRKIAAARRALVERADDRRFETFGLGFVGLLSGRV